MAGVRSLFCVVLGFLCVLGSRGQTVCGGDLTAPSGGPVTSPNYPGNYGDNENCEWTITVPEGSIIRLTFDSFNTEDRFDKLTIYDGASDNAAEIGRLSGEQWNIMNIISTSNTMFLRFTSDGSASRQGFQFSYTSRTAGQCWDPAVPANGNRDNNSNFTSGQTVRYTCMDGYQLWGTANITCQPNGTWSGATPTCRVCGGDLTAPSGGPVTSPNYPSNYGDNENCEWTITVPEGSIIRLTFDSFNTEDGYDFLTIYDGASDNAAEIERLTGQLYIIPIISTSNTMFLRFTSHRSVSAQGFQFSYTSSTAGQCWDPGVPANGNRDNNSNFTSGQTVRYTCMDGCQLWGTANITCQPNGTWSGATPTCRVCGGDLTAPSEGPVTLLNYPGNYGDNENCEWTITVPEGRIIRLTFDSFNTQNGYDVLTIYDGASDNAAEIEMLTGDQWNIIPIISTSNTMFLRLTSDERFSRQHREGFQFSYTSRTAGQCWDPGVPANGNRDNNSNFTSGQTVRYTCMDGYQLWGTANITCQPNGTWSGATPTCGCPTVVLYGGSDTLQASRMTSYTMTGHTYGDRPVYYSSVNCNYLYYHKPTMEWCVGPQFYSSYVRVRDSALYADQINGTFRLWKGTFLLWDRQGQWIENPDVKIACSDDVPADVVVLQSVGGATNCARVRLHGDADFLPSLVTIYNTTTWEFTRTDHTSSGRPIYVSDKDSRFSLDFNEYELMWLVSRTTGLSRDSAFVRNCAMTPDQIRSPWELWDGSQLHVVWSVTASCVACPELPFPTNGNRTEGQLHGDTVTFSCNEGYELIGPENRTCQTNQSWSGEQPKCSGKLCQQLMAPSNGNISGGSSYGDVVTYYCDAGYEISGDEERTCQSDQTWSGTQPSCVRKLCQQLMTPSNGNISGGISYGDVVTYHCDAGYEISGDEERTCQSDQTWSGTQPSCVPFPEAETVGLSTLHAVMIGVVPSVVLLVLGVVAGILGYRRGRKRQSDDLELEEFDFHPDILDLHGPSPPPVPPVPARPQFLEYEVNPTDLRLSEEIGRGAFGIVFLATLKRAVDGLLTEQTVVAKTVRENAGEEEIQNFIQEVDTTITLRQHINLLGLVGCCTLSHPPYLVTEYMPYGDLKNFLLKCRKLGERLQDSMYDFDEMKIYQVARQIANGMTYISQAGYVHGDLAARNVLVGENLVVKIADFGLTTDIYERGYQRQDAEQKIPLRWMAPERLMREGRYTSKSDVWSFGVVLYEIATLGNVPYPGRERTLLEELRTGYREPRPPGLKQELYDMMLRCWQWEEDDRPEFEDLYEELDAVVESMAEGYVKPGSGSPVGGPNEAAEALETSYDVPKSGRMGTQLHVTADVYISEDRDEVDSLASSSAESSSVLIEKDVDSDNDVQVNNCKATQQDTLLESEDHDH
ncbi:CUB and sushi domain-containing protein 3-like isoform X2 [Branchiostoma floridae x Branchiostoma belcheri]